MRKPNKSKNSARVVTSKIITKPHYNAQRQDSLKHRYEFVLNLGMICDAPLFFGFSYDFSDKKIFLK